jgi:hypothetical protein
MKSLYPFVKPIIFFLPNLENSSSVMNFAIVLSWPCLKDRVISSFCARKENRGLGL